MTQEDIVYDPEICSNATKISWSKNGFILYSCPDPESKSNLYITYMECIDGINWQLAPPKGYSIRSAQQIQDIDNQIASNPNYVIPPLPLISMVSYGPNSADLALVDEKGDLTILVTGVMKPAEPSRLPLAPSSLNEMEIIYNDQVSNTDLTTNLDLQNEIVAFEWFPMEKPVIINGPATRVSNSQSPIPNGAACKTGALFEDSMGQRYQYNVTQHKCTGPTHPINSKQACIGVRRNGEVTMWYQGEHGLDYFKLSIPLEQDMDSMNISRASMGFIKDGKIALCVYCEDTQILKLYMIAVDWGYLTYAAQMQKKMQHYVTPENNKTLPKLTVERYTREKFCDIDFKTGEYRTLKILKIVSPTYSQNTGLEILLGFESRQNGEIVSSVQVLKVELNPIAKFFQNSDDSKPSVAVPFSGATFKTREIIRCSDLLFSIGTSLGHTFIIFCYQSGAIDVIDRVSLQRLQNQFDQKKASVSFNNPSSLDQKNLELPLTITSLIDTGFEFMPLEFRPSFMVVSPTISSYVAMNPTTGKLVWKNLERASDLLVDSDNNNSFKKGFLVMTASSLAFTHTWACFNQAFTGDLITTILLEVQRVRKVLGDKYADQLVIAVIQECHRSINFQLDYTRENADKLLNHPPFQKLLCLQLSLGTTLNWQRNKSSMIAFYLLHLRLCSLIITLSLRTIFHQIQKETSANRSTNYEELYVKSNTVLSAIGFVRWLIDFCTLLNEELIEIGDQLNKNPEKKLEILNGHIVVPLLLNTISRSLLLYSIAGIKKLNEYTTKSVENLDTSFFKNFAILEAFERLNSLIKSSPIKLELFEKFISDIDSSIRSMKLDKVTTLLVETQLFCEATVPDVYVESISKLCSMYGSLAKKDFNMIDLFLYDVDWLNPNINVKINKQTKVVDDTSVYNHELILKFKNKKNALFIDELRKNLIVSRNLRRCILCGSVSSCDEIPLYQSDFINPTSIPFQRSCFCSGFWVNI